MAQLKYTFDSMSKYQIAGRVVNQHKLIRPHHASIM